MKVKVSPTIPVGCHQYSIIFDTEGCNNEDAYSFVSYPKRTIYFSKTTKSESQLMCNLTHEILHIINRVYASSQKLEESTIEGLAQGLGQFLTALGIEFDWSDIPKTDEKDS